MGALRCSSLTNANALGRGQLQSWTTDAHKSSIALKPGSPNRNTRQQPSVAKIWLTKESQWTGNGSKAASRKVPAQLKRQPGRRSATGILNVKARQRGLR